MPSDQNGGLGARLTARDEPSPDAMSAALHSSSHCKAPLLPSHHIHDEGLTLAHASSDANHSDAHGGKAVQEGDCCLRNTPARVFAFHQDEWDQ